jgi:hypothetical protein
MNDGMGLTIKKLATKTYISSSAPLDSSQSSIDPSQWTNSTPKKRQTVATKYKINHQAPIDPDQPLKDVWNNLKNANKDNITTTWTQHTSVAASYKGKHYAHE